MHRRISTLLRLLALAAVLPLAGWLPAQVPQAAAITADDELVLISTTAGNVGRIIIRDPHQAGGTPANWTSPDVGWERVTAGDLNGDGYDEVIALRTNQIRAFDPFRPSSTTAVNFQRTPPTGAWQLVAAGDFDGDGRDEIAAAHSEGSGTRLRVYRGNAAGTSWNEVYTEGFGAAFRMITTGDINDDGREDFGILRDTDRRMRWWSGANFSTLFDQTYQFTWTDMRVGEYARDTTTRKEIALTRQGVSFQLPSFYVWRWNGFNAMQELYQEIMYPNFTYLAPSDINGDGDEENLLLRSVNDNNVPQVTMRNISGTSMRGFEPSGLGPGWFNLAAGDIDGDGRDEPVILRPTVVRLYMQPEVNDSFEDISGNWRQWFVLANVDGGGISNQPELSVTPTSLSFDANYGGTPPAPKTFVVKNATNTGNLAWTASVIGGSSWINVSPSNGSAGPAGQTVSVTVNPIGLSPATYQGTVRITATQNGAPVAGSPRDVTVTMVVRAPSLVISPTSLSFVAQAGGTAPPPLLLQITNTGVQGVVGWNLAIVGNAPWLTVTPTSGIAPSQVTVGVSTASMPPGTHTATIRITAIDPTVGNSPVDVPVSLTITAPTLVVSPSTLSWVQERSTPVVPRQVSIIQAGGGSGINWTAGPIPLATWQEWKDRFLNEPQAFTRTERGWLYKGAAGEEFIEAFEWLTLSPNQGTTPTLMSVSFDPALMPDGITEVTIVVDGGPNSNNRFQGVDVTILLTAQGQLRQNYFPYMTP